MIKITFEAATIDEAIVILGKLAGGKMARAATAAPRDPEKPMQPPIRTEADIEKVVEFNLARRKARSDKGKARGKYAKGAGAEPATSPESEVPSPPPAPEAPPVVVEEPVAPVPAPRVTPQVAAPVPTADEARTALEEVFNTKGVQAALDVLARFGVKRGRDIPEDQRAQMIADCKAAL